MLLQTNSYIVPKDKRAEHARLLRRFRASLAKLGCDSFEVYEQVGANWTTGEPTGRYVQIMRFRDRRHQLAVQAAERNDPVAQAIIAEFCQLINFPYQQQQGLFAIGFYNGVLPMAPSRPQATDVVPAVVTDPESDEALAEDHTPYETVSEGERDHAEHEDAGHEADAAPAAEGLAEEEEGSLAADDAGQTEEPADNEPPAEHEGSDDADTSAVVEQPEPVSETDEGTSDGNGPQDEADSAPDPDELGALLDAHLHMPEGGEGDLGELDVVDEAEEDSHHAPKHAAR